jgi:sugar phosphate isomerase/epimerase
MQFQERIMLSTRTGNYPIGFRRGGSEWQRDLPLLINWARKNEIGVIDLGRSLEDIVIARTAGMHIGSVDLLEWQPMFSPDAGKRAEAVAKNAEYVAQACAAGATKFFIVILPEEPARPRRENFGYAAESLAALAPALEKAGGQLVIEGWPGPGALCCTPETYRAMFKEVPSPAIGINFDPSHLLRMGISPQKFVKEFAPRVGHVHGKDTEILREDLYEYGTEQPATFKKDPPFGGASWRYTIPGHGGSNWLEIFRTLQANGYKGAVSIELEDANYNGTTEGEQAGILAGARYLSMC